MALAEKTKEGPVDALCGIFSRIRSTPQMNLLASYTERIYKEWWTLAEWKIELLTSTLGSEGWGGLAELRKGGAAVEKALDCYTCRMYSELRDAASRGGTEACRVVLKEIDAAEEYELRLRKKTNVLRAKLAGLLEEIESAVRRALGDRDALEKLVQFTEKALEGKRGVLTNEEIIQESSRSLSSAGAPLKLYACLLEFKMHKALMQILPEDILFQRRGGSLPQSDSAIYVYFPERAPYSNLDAHFLYGASKLRIFLNGDGAAGSAGHAQMDANAWDLLGAIMRWDIRELVIFLGKTLSVRLSSTASGSPGIQSVENLNIGALAEIVAGVVGSEMARNLRYYSIDSLRS